MKSHTIVRWGLDVATLRARLASNTLDPIFEAHGNFIYASEDEPLMTSFFGNFWDVSAVFCVDTDDADLAAELTALVRANQATPAYLAAKAETDRYRNERIAEEAARLERARRGQR